MEVSKIYNPETNTIEIVSSKYLTSHKTSKLLSKLILDKKGLAYYNEGGQLKFDRDDEFKYPAYNLDQLLEVTPTEINSIPLVIKKHICIGYMEKDLKTRLGYNYFLTEQWIYWEPIVETMGRLIIKLFNQKYLKIKNV